MEDNVTKNNVAYKIVIENENYYFEFDDTENTGAKRRYSIEDFQVFVKQKRIEVRFSEEVVLNENVLKIMSQPTTVAATGVEYEAFRDNGVSNPTITWKQLINAVALSKGFTRFYDTTDWTLITE